MFIYLFWEREREIESEQERGREREGDRIPNRIHTVSTEPDAGLKPTNCEIMTWIEIKSQALNWLSHPGTLSVNWFLTKVKTTIVKGQIDQTQFNGWKNSLFWQMVLEQLDIQKTKKKTKQKWSWTPTSHHIQKLKWAKDLKLKR